MQLEIPYGEEPFAVSPNGHRVAVGTGNAVEIWEPRRLPPWAWGPLAGLAVLIGIGIVNLWRRRRNVTMADANPAFPDPG